MARYIDTDALEMELCRETFQPSKYCYPCREVLDAVNRIPSADVREVKRGKWKDEERGNDHYVICSECGDEYIENDLRLDSWVKQYFKFCPNCGAEMEGEE